MQKRALFSAAVVAPRRNSRYPAAPRATRAETSDRLEFHGPWARSALLALAVGGVASAMLGLLEGSTDLSDQLRAGLFGALLLVQLAAVALRGLDRVGPEQAAGTDPMMR